VNYSTDSDKESTQNRTGLQWVVGVAVYVCLFIVILVGQHYPVLWATDRESENPWIAFILFLAILPAFIAGYYVKELYQSSSNPATDMQQ